ncbi:MAG TPA: efflux RND transporter periplasmic adaptor subunit [Terriglobia bacterium]|nr:efflux RND transporter periplasmic adaptor subunit [Terriglobia bacterium]
MDELNTQTEEQQAPTPTPRPTSRRYLIVVAVVLALLLIAAAVVRRDDARNGDAQIPQSSAPRSSEVTEATPEQLKQIRVEAVREDLMDLDLETTGKVGFNEDRMTPVFAPYGGRVLSVLVNKGDLVGAGQPLLIVESPELVATVNDLSEARANADKARIALDIADKAAQRARSLNAQDALATKELQAAESDLARAREDSRRAQAAVSVVRNRLALFGKSTDEIAQLEESVTDQIDRRIVIRAPLAGTIVDRKVGPGQYIKPDTPDPLYLISDLSSVWVNGDIYENLLPQIRVGAPVEITVPAYPDRKFPARISAINPTVDAATRTIHVRCLVPNTSGLLKPEMFASIRVGQAAKRKVLTVPSKAILTQGSDSFVLLEESAGRFRRRSVMPGREVHGHTIIEKGLGADDRVVTSGVLLLNSGLDGK